MKFDKEVDSLFKKSIKRKLKNPYLQELFEELKENYHNIYELYYKTLKNIEVHPNEIIYQKLARIYCDDLDEQRNSFHILFQNPVLVNLPVPKHTEGLNIPPYKDVFHKELFQTINSLYRCRYTIYNIFINLQQDYNHIRESFLDYKSLYEKEPLKQYQEYKEETFRKYLELMEAYTYLFMRVMTIKKIEENTNEK